MAAARQDMDSADPITAVNAQCKWITLSVAIAALEEFVNPSSPRSVAINMVKAEMGRLDTACEAVQAASQNERMEILDREAETVRGAIELARNAGRSSENAEKEAILKAIHEFLDKITAAVQGNDLQQRGEAI
jgi:uncharacterized protein YqeY